VLWIEMSELTRRDLCLQIPHVPGRHIGIERRSVHEFQWPGPYVEGYILPPHLSSSIDHATQSDMGKRAPHVRVDLNGLHAWTLCLIPAVPAERDGRRETTRPLPGYPPPPMM